jgi:hypothetical protein
MSWQLPIQVSHAKTLAAKNNNIGLFFIYKISAKDAQSLFLFQTILKKTPLFSKTNCCFASALPSFTANKKKAPTMYIYSKLLGAAQRAPHEEPPTRCSHLTMPCAAHSIYAVRWLPQTAQTYTRRAIAAVEKLRKMQ